MRRERVVAVKRVLIADDTEVMRMMIRMALESAGFSIVGEALDGAQAVAMYHELRPDVVTLDITMPHKDGIEACCEILAADPQARIVMVTALGHEDRIRAAVRAGARDFIVKPFEPERIIKAVKKACGLP